MRIPANVALRAAGVVAGAVPAFCEDRVRRPFFVVGCGRSGTTLLNSVVGKHPDVAAFPAEANDLWHPRLYPWHEARLEALPFWKDPHAFTQRSLAARTPADDRRLKAVFGAFQALRGGRCFLNKTVMATFMLPYMLKLFPDARFVHLYRDGRAVAWSYAVKERPKLAAHARYAEKGYALAFDDLLETFAAHWRDHILELEAQKEALGLTERKRILELSYEDLCRDPKAQLARLAAFMDVAPDPFLREDYTHVANTNYKFRQELAPETIAKLTGIMARALTVKGYAAAPEADASFHPARRGAAN